jgi:hypothetical protein
MGSWIKIHAVDLKKQSQLYAGFVYRMYLSFNLHILSIQERLNYVKNQSLASLWFTAVGFFFFGCNTGILFQNETKADYYDVRMGV